MAIYRTDYKLKEARELIESLDDSKENELIKYYISKKEKHIEEQNKKLEEYRTWFKQLDRFLPNKNMVMG